jgi:hypothetical protein
MKLYRNALGQFARRPKRKPAKKTARKAPRRAAKARKRPAPRYTKRELGLLAQIRMMQERLAKLEAKAAVKKKRKKPAKKKAAKKVLAERAAPVLTPIRIVDLPKGAAGYYGFVQFLVPLSWTEYHIMGVEFEEAGDKKRGYKRTSSYPTREQAIAAYYGLVMRIERFGSEQGLEAEFEKGAIYRSWSNPFPPYKHMHEPRDNFNGEKPDEWVGACPHPRPEGVVEYVPWKERA